jgi:hypothetical protein
VKNLGQVTGTIADKSFDTTTDKTLSATKAQALTALSVLPDAPTIVAPATFSGVATVPIGLPGLSSATMTIDFTEWDTGIDIFKFIVRGVLSIWFFFMAVRAIKQAFA